VLQLREQKEENSSSYFVSERFQFQELPLYTAELRGFSPTGEYEERKALHPRPMLGA